MMTKEQAKSIVEAELRLLKLTKPMTTEEMTSFCQEMYKRLQFKSANERLADIRLWADQWQSTIFHFPWAPGNLALRGSRQRAQDRGVRQSSRPK
jgi:hypothetical protein